MMAVGQKQAAQKQFSLLSVVVELRLILRRQQSYDRRKKVFLVKVKQHLAIVRVLDADGTDIFLCRLSQRRHAAQHQAQTQATNCEATS